MKLFEAKERALDGNTFYIRPFPAFKSANISGELFSLILPMLGSLAPMAKNLTSGNDDNLLDIDIDEMTPSLVKGLSGLSGDKVERLLKLLLVRYKNISVEPKGKDEAVPLTEDLANELFCGNTQDMYILAVDVIKVNYAGFFKRLGNLFGGQANGFLNLIQKTPGLEYMEDLT